MRIKSIETYRAAAYIRVSTEEQTEYSPDSQLKVILDYAKRNGMTVSEESIYSDEGISGRTAAKRPGFMKMIGDAKKTPSPFSHILVWKFSRFARSREDSIIYKTMLKKQYGIDVISVSEALGKDKTSILIEAMLEAMDEYYSLNLGEEVRRGMNEKFSRGGIITKAPLGYRINGGALVPEESGAKAVRAAFDLFNSGLSLTDTARAMNASGLRSAKGNLFDCRSVKYILTNPVYIGYVRMSSSSESREYYNQTAETVKGSHPPLIDEASFNEAAIRLTSVRRS